MTVASEQLRSIVDRILRLKAEQDDLALDIREVYAEAKGNGWDKTALGQLVSYIRKRDKDPEKFAEGSAVFDLYLSAYEQTGTALATHTHEAKPELPAPHSKEGDGGHPSPSSDPEAQKAGADHTPVEQGRESASLYTGQSDQQPAAEPQDRNEPVSATAASADKYEAGPIPAFLDRTKQARAV